MDASFVISTPEMWLLGSFILIGIGFIVFSKEGFTIFAGMVVLAGVSSIVYTHHCAAIDKQFVLDQFKQGKALECGLFRGESVLVDPSNGWRYEESIGFIKGDAIRNDPELCRVINKEAPEPSSIPYWIAFITTVFGVMLLRYALRTNEKLTHTNEESDDEPRTK